MATTAELFEVGAGGAGVLCGLPRVEGCGGRRWAAAAGPAGSLRGCGGLTPRARSCSGGGVAAGAGNGAVPEPEGTGCGSGGLRDRGGGWGGSDALGGMQSLSLPQARACGGPQAGASFPWGLPGLCGKMGSSFRQGHGPCQARPPG